MLRPILAIVIAIGLITGAIYVAAGRGSPPRITIGKPDRVVGQTGALEVTAEAPNGRLTALTDSLEQDGRTTPLFALAGNTSPGLPQLDRDHVRLIRHIATPAPPSPPPPNRQTNPAGTPGRGRSDCRQRHAAVVPQPASALLDRDERLS